MPPLINRERCNGCGQAAESCCQRVCPGDLLIRKDGKAELRDRRSCWDCAACVKACPRQAIRLVLPAEIGGGRAWLGIEGKEWVLNYPDGKQERFPLPETKTPT